MAAKVCNVTINVICLEEDAQQVKGELDEWFNGSDVGMFRFEGARISIPYEPTEHIKNRLDLNEGG